MQEIQDIQERMDNFVQVATARRTKETTRIIATDPTEVARGYPEGRREKGYTYIIDPAALLYTGTNAVDATPFVRTKLGL